MNDGTFEPLVTIAQVIVDFCEGKIQQCLSGLKKIVDHNPECPADIWLAIGVCYSKLNNLPKAKFSFENVLSLEETNAFAMTCLAITEL